MSLIELTVVIFVLMGLISILFLGAQAWKRGSDRGLCVLNIQLVQKAVRSYGNLYGHDPGTSVSGLRSKIFAPGAFLETDPTCRGGGIYSFGAASGENTIPPIGHVYLKCSFSDSRDHQLPGNAEW